MNIKQTVGKQGENLVKEYLESQGYTIIDQNFRIAASEIDIIAQKKDVITFVEVKTRNSRYFAHSDLITHKKKKAIMYGARWYLSSLKCSDTYSVRFDVCFVTLNKNPFELEYIENAFTLETEYF